MANKRTDKPLRRSGLVSPFGVGAIVDYADGQSLITSAIDFWPHASKPCPPALKISEPRLCNAMRISEIRLPPDYERDGPIPAGRFPAWQHCPKCHVMSNRNVRDCNSPKCKNSKTKMLPMRFIALCSSGHISDIDWMGWVHGEEGCKQDCVLSYKAGRSASLSGISIECTCRKRRSLAGLFSSMQQNCKGHRPWLGEGANESCDQTMRAAQKGASNVYFPKTESAIFIPNWAEEKSNKVQSLLENQEFWRAVDATLENNVPNRQLVEAFAATHELGADELHDAIVAKLTGHSNDNEELELKPAEYNAIISCSGSPEEELYVKKINIKKYNDWMKDYFSGVYLVPKLRETRILSGFTRLQPPNTSELSQIQPVSRDLRWLPGIKVTGEGFLLTFNIDKLLKFTDNSKALARSKLIEKNINSNQLNLGRELINISLAEIIIHTFAHLVIRSISYECGYGSSALRERIYVDLASPTPMAGVLIYTASGDSEGSLGGIVRQGEPGRLENSIFKGLQSADWCSSDPVCAEINGQGSNGANLAACHACTLLPETSCEYGNRLLDRMVVVGSAEDRDLGFFGQILG